MEQETLKARKAPQVFFLRRFVDNVTPALVYKFGFGPETTDEELERIAQWLDRIMRGNAYLVYCREAFRVRLHEIRESMRK